MIFHLNMTKKRVSILIVPLALFFNAHSLYFCYRLWKEYIQEVIFWEYPESQPTR